MEPLVEAPQAYQVGTAQVGKMGTVGATVDDIPT
jgi:hypothetical protein